LILRRGGHDIKITYDEIVDWWMVDEMVDEMVSCETDIKL